MGCCSCGLVKYRMNVYLEVGGIVMASVVEAVNRSK
jgi:hypothetical protein